MEQRKKVDPCVQCSRNVHCPWTHANELISTPRSRLLSCARVVIFRGIAEVGELARNRRQSTCLSFVATNVMRTNGMRRPTECGAQAFCSRYRLACFAHFSLQHTGVPGCEYHVMNVIPPRILNLLQVVTLSIRPAVPPTRGHATVVNILPTFPPPAPQQLCCFLEHYIDSRVVVFMGQALPWHLLPEHRVMWRLSVQAWEAVTTSESRPSTSC